MHEIDATDIFLNRIPSMWEVRNVVAWGRLHRAWGIVEIKPIFLFIKSELCFCIGKLEANTRAGPLSSHQPVRNGYETVL